MDKDLELRLKTDICIAVINTSSVASLNKADAGTMTNKIWEDLTKAPDKEAEGHS